MRQVLHHLLETVKVTRWIYHNRREGMKEALTDIEEGADIIMIKRQCLILIWFQEYQKQPMYRSQRTVSAVNMPWSRLPLKWAGSMKKKSSAKWQQVHTEQV